MCIVVAISHGVRRMIRSQSKTVVSTHFPIVVLSRSSNLSCRIYISLQFGNAVPEFNTNARLRRRDTFINDAVKQI